MLLLLKVFDFVAENTHFLLSTSRFSPYFGLARCLGSPIVLHPSSPRLQSLKMWHVQMDLGIWITKNGDLDGELRKNHWVLVP
jgi:hypothetical protein